MSYTKTNFVLFSKNSSSSSFPYSSSSSSLLPSFFPYSLISSRPPSPTRRYYKDYRLIAFKSSHKYNLHHFHRKKKEGKMIFVSNKTWSNTFKKLDSFQLFYQSNVGIKRNTRLKATMRTLQQQHFTNSCTIFFCWSKNPPEQWINHRKNADERNRQINKCKMKENKD